MIPRDEFDLNFQDLRSRLWSTSLVLACLATVVRPEWGIRLLLCAALATMVTLATVLADRAWEEKKGDGER